MTEGGITAIFLANRPLLCRMLVARTGSATEAEEILQEIWLRLGTARIGPVGEPIAYLMRMGLNLATDRKIADQRRGAREQAWLALQPGDAEHPDPERQLASSEELARLDALLRAMPERMHRALVLFRIEGRSQRHIADELGISVSGVEKLLARAYRQLIEFQHDTLFHITHDRTLPDAGSWSNDHG